MAATIAETNPGNGAGPAARGSAAGRPGGREGRRYRFPRNRPVGDRPCRLKGRRRHSNRRRDHRGRLCQPGLQLLSPGGLFCFVRRRGHRADSPDDQDDNRPDDLEGLIFAGEDREQMGSHSIMILNRGTESGSRKATGADNTSPRIKGNRMPPRAVSFGPATAARAATIGRLQGLCLRPCQKPAPLEGRGAAGARLTQWAHSGVALRADKPCCIAMICC